MTDTPGNAQGGSVGAEDVAVPAAPPAVAEGNGRGARTARRNRLRPPTDPSPYRVAVLATCLAEAFAPQVAEAAAELVVRTGVEVEVVGGMCCGQPAWNAGYPDEARLLAERLIQRLTSHDLVVVPSGSCATMLLRYYPHLFTERSGAHRAAVALAQRTRELSAYLLPHLPRIWPAVRPQEGRGSQASAGTADQVTPAALAFHPSCHSLRGAGVGQSGQRCLAAAGFSLCPHQWAEECCGFGGLFAVKEPALSTAMADTKLESLRAAGARVVVSGELGCLLHLEGRAVRRALPLTFRHLAEVLQERLPDRPASAEPGG